MALTTRMRLGAYEILEVSYADPAREIYKATDTSRNQPVTINVLPAGRLANPAVRARFEEQARAALELTHPHICRLLDVGRESPASPQTAEAPVSSDVEPVEPADGATVDASDADERIDFLVFEYLEGQTLDRRLERGSLPLREAVTISIAIADALEAAHRQRVLHRDLRPSNVMLTRDGAVKLLNCGLADPPQVPLHGVSPLARTVAVDGAEVATAAATLDYAAPEQLEGLTSDPRSDIFSLGVLLYEMVTGTKAFQGKNQTLLIAAIMSLDLDPLSKLRPGTPRALDHVAERCLEKNPEERWQTAHDLGIQLRWIAEGGAVLPSATTVWDRLLRLALAAAVILAVVATASAFVLLRADEPEPFQFRIPVYGISPADIAGYSSLAVPKHT